MIIAGILCLCPFHYYIFTGLKNTIMQYTIETDETLKLFTFVQNYFPYQQTDPVHP